MRDPCLVNRAISPSFNFDRAIVWCEHATGLDLGTHEARVASHNNRQDLRQLSLDAPARHEVPRSNPPKPGLPKHSPEIPAALVRLMSAKGAEIYSQFPSPDTRSQCS